MRPLNAAELIDAWDRGQRQSMPRRALTLLAAVGADPNSLEAMPLGERDAQLLAMRISMFGSEICSLSDCPVCAAVMEMNFDTADIAVPPAPNRSENQSICSHGYRVMFRVPNAGDAVWLADLDFEQDMVRALFETCLMSAAFGDETVNPADVPDEVAAEVSAAMEQLDPQADIQIMCACTECGHRWSSVFDTPAFVWSEIDAAARRILIEVHTLASAYGWREADILNMSAGRRGHYLDMING